ncbi:MAG: glycosyltransferase [Chloroflexota bacterium]
MKIIYFSLDYTPHDHRFLSALAESEHEVFYVRLQRGARQTEGRPVPSEIHQVQWLGGRPDASRLFVWRDVPALVWDFQRLIRTIKPDLVHAGPIQTCAFIASLACAGTIPILCMSWGFDLMKDVERGRWWRFATRYTLKHSNYFISDAYVTRDKAIAYGMQPDKTVVFPWGVDLSHFSPKALHENGADSIYPNNPEQEGFTLFCNRSWELNYGLDVLAKAFVIAAQQNPQLSLLLLAGGSQGPVIRKILADGGVMERVTFAGQIGQKELPYYYRMADLYISASHVDGSSVSLMEALACGLPCLVSDIPANKEWVIEDRNGWLFPDGDVNTLAAKILSAAEHRTDLPAIGLHARQTAEEKANWPNNFKKLLAAYEETVKYA